MRLKYFVLLLIIFIPFQLQAQSIPLNGLSIRLVPKDAKTDKVAPKNINILSSRLGYRVMWYSLVKELQEQTMYPTYRINANRGVIEINNFELKTSFFHPSLWGNGYIRSETALPLWIDPEYLALKGRQKRTLNIGLLNGNKHLIKQAPDSLFDQVNFFQSLYDQYVQGGVVKEEVNLRKSVRKSLKKFTKEFFLVHKVAKTKAELFVGDKKTKLDAVIIGNAYFNLVVIDDPLNPLVIHFKIFDNKVPTVFKQIFKRFKKHFEFRVTQLKY
ncbi:hypothetical protein BVY03_03700 [bacterium K02(2017)]|nr:hypothetical protein BVY03_03700 [bacterium K02(2017)]